MTAAAHHNAAVGERIRIRGLVQGVGLRPAVWQLAARHALRGRVWNDAEGILIHAWGAAGALERFISELQDKPPPLARIDTVERAALAGGCDMHGFEIVDSHAGTSRTDVAADAALCPDCLADISDPANRRYRYALANCSHCGPRLSIIRAMPYDRANTSMSAFAMCPECQAEYDNPADRRFHAQPNACPACGPRLSFADADGREINGDALQLAATHLRAGGIVAVKGIGGFHLACAAENGQAVARLRQRKRRRHKPFALMARDAEQIRRFASLSVQEQQLLESSAAPVLLLDALEGHSLAESVAPAQAWLGFMLPYTPLHRLLLQELAGPIVLTSGNITDEPQCTDNDEAKRRLHGVADAFLLHERIIINRLDDSLLQLAAGRPRLLRRARGYAPAAIRLPTGFDRAGRILAMGGEQKNAFCLLAAGQAVVSQHMGDLEHASVRRDYRQSLELYRRLYGFSPDAIAVDLHPDYASSQLGRQLAADEGVELLAVQHHHAHIAACMAEHGLPADARVLGIALDGLGYGHDGTLRGGEFLLAGYADCRGLGSIQAVPMPGGNSAAREPWRNAYAHLHAVGWPQLRQRFAATAIVRLLERKPWQMLETMMAKGVNSPPVSSCGRLFDAVAAALGLCAETVSFEGQAAMQLETLAAQAFAGEQGNGYPAAIDEAHGRFVIGWRPMWLALLHDLEIGIRKEVIAARFHHGLIAAIAALAATLTERHSLTRVALGGGSFQNRLLLTGVMEALACQSLQVLAPERLPANDGGLCLGQAAIAAARRLAAGQEPFLFPASSLTSLDKKTCRKPSLAEEEHDEEDTRVHILRGNES